MRADPVAIVPVKRMQDAKVRLAHVVEPRARAMLARSLFEHVTGVLVRAGLRTIALTPELHEPIAPTMEVWHDAGRGLNGALRSALSRFRGPAFVVPADLPWLAPEDVWRALAEPGDVVVCRSTDGGTNGLLMRARIEPAFGPDSALAHARAARRAGLQARVVRIDGFERDLDDAGALRAALSSADAICGWAGEALRQVGVPRREHAGL
jgi:2-phospho-L-lactate guanylyltransferase